MSDLSVALYDNGGESFDRYTAVFTTTNGEDWYLAMSEHPFHPQGFGQHGEGDVSGVYERDILIALEDAPEDVRKCIEQDIKAWIISGLTGWGRTPTTERGNL